MNVRGSIVAALLVVELAICGEFFIAIGGRQTGPGLGSLTAFGARLIEGGPHRTFSIGSRPALTVDIGYADLTIVASRVPRIDVSVSPSAAGGMFRATTPITASADGETVRVATAGSHPWTTGDDRMVTVLVPPETQVTVVNAGDIKAEGLRADASLKSIGRGTITVDDYDAPTLHVASSNGRIALRGVVAARLEANSANDRIDGADLQIRNGDVESSDGVTLRFAAGADTLVTADTANGKVRLSGFAGRASVTTQTDDADDSSLRTVRIGGGEGRLDVHALDGNINLTEAG